MKILMVCLGNICRSPLAEGILRDKVNSYNLDWTIDSCGTSAYHIGEKPDSRGMATAKRFGIDISDQRARQFRRSDLDDFDLILAMDSSNYRDIISYASTEEHRDKVHLMLDFLFPGQDKGVPDPYYDGGFDNVFHMLDQACERLIQTYTKA